MEKTTSLDDSIVGRVDLTVTVEVLAEDFERAILPLLKVASAVDASIIVERDGSWWSGDFQVPVIAGGDAKPARDSVRQHLRAEPQVVAEVEALIDRFAEITR